MVVLAERQTLDLIILHSNPNWRWHFCACTTTADLLSAIQMKLKHAIKNKSEMLEPKSALQAGTVCGLCM